MDWWRRRRPTLADRIRPRLAGLDGDLTDLLAEQICREETDRLIGFVGLVDEVAALDETAGEPGTLI